MTTLDIGSDIDDAYALALAIVSPELELRGITTVGKNAEDRAWMICRFLTHSGTKPIPVAWGQNPQAESDIDWQIQYRRHPAPIFNRTQKPIKESAVEFLYAKLKENPGKYYQDRVYGEREGGGTQCLYLSHVPFANLGLPELPEESVPQKYLKWQKRVYSYLAVPAVLYASVVGVIRNNWKDHQEHMQEEQEETGLRPQL